MSKTEKVTCRECGQVGYLKIRRIRGHEYVVIRHVEEHYLGRLDGKPAYSKQV